MELPILIDPDSDLPTYHQIYEQLRRAILIGRLPSRQRVPSIRELARSLGVSCTTITQSYELLHSEGYLQSIIGSGTFVSEQLPEDLLSSTSTQPAIDSVCNSWSSVRLSQYGSRLVRLSETPIPKPFPNSLYKPLRLDPATLQQWRKLLRHHLRSENWTDLENAFDPLGLYSLREAIAYYIRRTRAVQCDAAQIIIVSSTLQALTLITSVLVDQGDEVILENPGCPEVHQLFLSQGVQLHPVPIDDSGMITEHLPSVSTTKTKLVYVTPSHQFPLGGVLSLHRRHELLNWANQSGVVIIEDDYDSEYRYCGRPIPSLQGLDRNDSVIYVGDFSGALFPVVNIGYFVAPPPLVPVLACAKRLSYSRVPLLEQYILTDFINQGHLERHIRRTWKRYAQRRHFLIEQLQLHLGDRVTILGEDAGVHLTVRLHNHSRDEETIERIAQQKIIEWVGTSPYYLRDARPNEFVVSYADLNQQEIQDVVQSLAQILAD
ncbi:PLP-dependent aminotransferase family protein [Pleurocapsales cyanobacterium LEGE 06147]|nr:PLP-dependent aminotransferase family protein [Pleurocapsales cyanobacterium LEGE 06147]